MKTHTNNFKNEIKKLGKQISSKVFHYFSFSLVSENNDFIITESGLNIVSEQFNENDSEQILEENINDIKIIQDGQLLKSLMKRIEIETNEEFDIKDIIKVQFGILIENDYEYLDYGNYVVYKKSYNASNKSWEYVCYDMMLYSMIQYKRLNISYPITVRNYLKAIADKMGIGFANENDNFTNYNQLIEKDYFQGKNVTLRDMLDFLSQVTASVICINENDKLEVRYPQNVGEYETKEGTSLSIENVDDVDDFSYELNGNTVQNGTPTPTSPIAVETVSGRQAVNVLGKNVFDYTTTTFSSPSRVNMQFENNVITMTTTGTYTSNDLFFRTKIPDEYLENGASYTLSSVNVSGVAQSLKLQLRNKDTSSAGKTASDTVVFDDTYSLFIVGNIFATSSSTSIPSGTTAIIKNIQVEKGTQSTTYEEYIGNTYEINLGKNLIDTSKFTNAGNTNITQIPTGVRATFVGSQGTYRWAYYRIPNSTDYFGKTCTITADIYNSASNKGSIRVWQLGSGNEAIGNQIGSALNSSGSVTITFPSSFSSGAVSFGLLFYSNVNGTISNGDYVDFTNLQFELGSQATSYSEYKTPIELCKIQDYKDFIRKGTGKNLLNIQGIVKGRLDSGNIGYESSVDTLTLNENSFSFTTNANNRGVTTDYIGIESGSYTISSNNLNSTYSLKVACYNGSKIWFQDATFTGNSSEKRRIITIPSGTSFIRIYFALSSAGSITITNPQLERGNSITLYEPYGFKDKWYLYKEIGKYVFIGDSSENWFRLNSYDDNYLFQASGVSIPVPNYSTNYLSSHSVANTATYSTSTLGSYFNNNVFRMRVPGTYATTVSEFKTWLASNNVSLYYPLPVATATEIADTELINQLESVKLLEGLNNVLITSSDLSTPIKMTYLKYFDTIDEEYLKDVNVNFGEKFGPINKISLVDSENEIEYMAQDDIAIEKNKMIEVKIKDNPITLNNNQEIVCNNILKKLSGISYSLNDFNSTGVCYYDYLDIFKVSIEGKSYKCLLLNDEIEITQGLQETIYSDELENSNVETDNYETNNLTNKEVQQKIVQLSDNKVENKSVVSSINGSKEQTVIETNKILNRKTITATTDSDGFISTGLNKDYIVLVATAQFSSNDYGFTIPYYYYNSGNPTWYVRIENKNHTVLANTQITVMVYYAKIKEGYEWQI